MTTTHISHRRFRAIAEATIAAGPGLTAELDCVLASACPYPEVARAARRIVRAKSGTGYYDGPRGRQRVYEELGRAWQRGKAM